MMSGNQCLQPAPGELPTPHIHIEDLGQEGYEAYWAALIPAVPDLISQEQFHTLMSYESALAKLLQEQQQWIAQLHGEEHCILSLRIIKPQDDPDQELILGLVGKVKAHQKDEASLRAQNFYNLVRDTLPNGYPLQAGQSQDLDLLRQPFPSGELAEFQRGIHTLQTLNLAPELEVAPVIAPWQSHPSLFQTLFRVIVGHPAPLAIAFNLFSTRLRPDESAFMVHLANEYALQANQTQSQQSQLGAIGLTAQYQLRRLEAEQAATTWSYLHRILQTPFELTILIRSATPIPYSLVAVLQSAISSPLQQQECPISGFGVLVKPGSRFEQAKLGASWSRLHPYHLPYPDSRLQRLLRLPWLFSPQEVHSVFRLPIADRWGTWGLPSSPKAQDARRLIRDIPQKQGIELGGLQLEPAQLTQHLLVSGVPGSGKTNTCLQLLHQLAEQGIPWMVLEPAKAEYRGLLGVPGLGEKLLIFTLGDEGVAPFRFNPFELPRGISLDAHLGGLVDLFSVSMSLWGVLPNVIEQLISEAYRRKGFTMLGQNEDLQPPRFSDIRELISELVPQLGYKQETTDEITAALTVRLNRFCQGALGRMLDTPRSLPFEFLMHQPVILEMSQLTNTDDRAFVMGMILQRCYQHWWADWQREDHQETHPRLRHLLLIEEAHNLLARTSENMPQEQANPKGKAVQNFAHMLAEIRAFGQGIAISEQNPAGLIPEVMVNTNLKIAHRVVESYNRAALGRAMLLTPQQEKALATLQTGQTFYYMGGSSGPKMTTVAPFKDSMDSGFRSRVGHQMLKEHFQEQVGRLPYQDCYKPPAGFSAKQELFFSAELAAGLVQSLLTHPAYQAHQSNMMVQLLMVPFNPKSLSSIQLWLNKLLVEQGANHLTQPEQVTTICQSALSLLLLKAVQAKARIHGWLGEDITQAHQLLVKATLEQENIQQDWINLCRIPEHLLAMKLPHPAYQAWDPLVGVFRYEAKVVIASQEELFTKLLTLKPQKDSQDNPEQRMAARAQVAQIFRDWVQETLSETYSELNPEFQDSLLSCVAIELTNGKNSQPRLLDIYLGKSTFS